MFAIRPWIWVWPVILVFGGCALRPGMRTEVNSLTAKRRAMEYLISAVGYAQNPAVRVEAVEALESSGEGEALPWIRSALTDEEPAVRFAACVALGNLRDGVALESLRRYVDDPDPSVQVAALFALHRLGDTRRSGRIPNYVLLDPSPTVRRNAAMVLGLLGEPGAIRVLARAMRDRDPGVRQHALEAMARLGNRESRKELTFMTNAGVGSQEVFAISALSATADPVFVDTLQYKLTTAMHTEVRLAAARGLGRLGSDRGFGIALAALNTRRATRRDVNDPPAEQILRARQMAAAALAAIGRRDALPALVKVMDNARDPRIQVSAAGAVLQLLRSAQDRVLASPPSTTDRARAMESAPRLKTLPGRAKPKRTDRSRIESPRTRPPPINPPPAEPRAGNIPGLGRVPVKPVHRTAPVNDDGFKG